MEDRIKIQELIAHFANSFDMKDWGDWNPVSLKRSTRIILICAAHRPRRFP